MLFDCEVSRTIVANSLDCARLIREDLRVYLVGAGSKTCDEPCSRSRARMNWSDPYCTYTRRPRLRGTAFALRTRNQLRRLCIGEPVSRPQRRLCAVLRGMQLSNGTVVFDITTRCGRERSREVWTGVSVRDCTHEQITAARVAGYDETARRVRSSRRSNGPRARCHRSNRDIWHELLPSVTSARVPYRAAPLVSFHADRDRQSTPRQVRRELGRRLAAQQHARASDAKSDLDTAVETASTGATPRNPRLARPTSSLT